MTVDADSKRAPQRRLVIFEGIMGSGKSSSTRWLGQRLATRGFDAAIRTERQFPHPLRATDFAAEWFKPWLDMTADDLASRRLGLWAKFVEEALGSQTVHVVDGQLFHGDLTNMFLMNMPPYAIAQNVQALAEVIRPLHPLLVYYYQSDVDRAIRLTAAERGEELGVRYQVDWKLKYAYAMERGLEGLDGLSSLYADYRVLTDRLFAQITIDKIAIENSARDWPAYYARIEDALGF
jgi:broad specificity phosphatase PhoE